MAVTGVPTEGNIQPVVPASCGDGGLVPSNIRFDGTSVVTPDATTDTPNQAAGQMIEGWDEVNQVARVMRMTPSGAIIISFAPSTGTTMASFPFVAIPPGAIVPLPVPPVGTTEYSFTALGTAGDVTLVRNAVDPIGTGLPVIATGGNGKIGGLTGAIPAALVAEAFATNAAGVHMYVTAFGP